MMELTCTFTGSFLALKHPQIVKQGPITPMTPAHIPICNQFKLLTNVTTAAANQKISSVRCCFHFTAGSGLSGAAP